MNNKISIIMGVFNSNPSYLKKAINSILQQTFKDFEFIICDDCTTNIKTKEVLEYYRKCDTRIKVINNKENSGLAYSLNKCLVMSQGKYIARMDDDDISLPDRFEKQIYFLENNSEYDFCGTSIKLFNEKGTWGTVINKERPNKKDFLFGSPFTHPTIMVRKEAYDKVKGYRVENYTKRTEDYDMFMRMYAAGLKGYNLSDQLYLYRMDLNGYKKQKFKYRLDEVRVKYQGFKELDLFPEGYLYLLKPIASGLVPAKLKQKIYQKRFK